MNDIFLPYLKKIDEVLLSCLPEAPSADWRKTSFFPLDGCENACADACILEQYLKNLISPCLSLLKLGGKRWRPLLMVLCAQMAHDNGKAAPLSEDEIYSLSPLVEFAHTASLIHDDIEDSADMRRGKPSAHIEYGLDTALNSASWLYFEATTSIESLNADEAFKNRLYTLYMVLLRRLHFGQAMDIYWHRNPDIFPSVSEYTQMVRCKTGTLARLAVQLGFMAGGASEEEIEAAGKIAETLGEGFQILDDTQNLCTGNPGKKRGDDIVEGKKSLPILLHAEETPQDKQKIAHSFERAKKEGIDSPAVEECIALLESRGAITKARESGRKLIAENIHALCTCIHPTEKCTKNAEGTRLIQLLFSEMTAKM